jgi:hypothetical protein
VEGGLVDVEDLVVVLAVDEDSQLLNESHLLRLERFLLSKALPVGVVRSNVLDLILDVVPSQSHGIEGPHLVSISHNHCSLLQAQMHHTLKGVDACHPLYLLLIEDSLSSFSMCLQD